MFIISIIKPIKDIFIRRERDIAAPFIKSSSSSLIRGFEEDSLAVADVVNPPPERLIAIHIYIGA